MFTVTQERVTVPVGRDREERKEKEKGKRGLIS